MIVILKWFSFMGSSPNLLLVSSEFVISIPLVLGKRKPINLYSLPEIRGIESFQGGWNLINLLKFAKHYKQSFAILREFDTKLSKKVSLVRKH